MSSDDRQAPAELGRFDAVVFPGQGSQKAGMGIDFMEKFPESRAIFERASRTLGYDVAELCSAPEGDGRLARTDFAQPCLLTVKIAIYEALRARHGLRPRFFGGHSLGEYTALVAAGVFELETALRVVRRRGELMYQAVEPGLSRMVAVIAERRPGGDGTTESYFRLPMPAIRRAASREEVDVANYNSARQIVLSGLSGNVDRVLEALGEPERAGRIRLEVLATGAPFHSRHLAKIAPELRQSLEEVRGEIRAEAARRVTANRSGKFHTGKLDDLLSSLSSQACSPVLWEANMRELERVSEAVLEIGPQRTLSGFFRSRGTAVPAVTCLRTLRKVVEASISCVSPGEDA